MCNNSVKIVLFGSFSCCESSFHTQCIYEGVRGGLDLQAASSVRLPLPFQFTMDIKRRLWEMLFICISSFTFIHRVFFFFSPSLLFCVEVLPVNTQCCDSFRRAEKGLIHTYTCFHSPQTSL